jgi:signal transduction histidine kinase
MRLAAAYAALLIVALGVTGASVLWQQNRIGLRRVDRELDTLATTLANSLRDELRESQDPKRAARTVLELVAAANHGLAIIDEQGAVLGARWNGEALPTARLTGTAATETIATAQGAWRVLHRQEGEGRSAFTLVVTTPLSDVERERRESREAMLVGIPIVFLLAAGGGLYLSSMSVRPVARALDAQRRFTADAAHELRTPVSVIRSAAEVTLNRDHRDESEYREALRIIGAQARGLARLVQNMLVLARADAGAYPVRPMNLYLDELVMECRHSLRALALERGVDVVADHVAETPYHGDEDLLRQMILNVLQNAMQHALRGSVVHVDLQSDADRITMRVTNRGECIPVADQARIFDRFVQLDPSRRSEGAGLGLPIARWIARMHRGDVLVERSDQSQTTFCISLPSIRHV